jgi:large subunit ribosomal protein L5
MNYIENYFNSVVKYDLINKYYYTKLSKIPKMCKIIVVFRFKELNVKQLSAALLALELITSKKGQLIAAKKGNLFLKIRKGFPIGCKIILQKKAMYNHLLKLIDEVFHKIKTLLKLNKNITKHENIVFYKLNDISLFTEIEYNYNLFNGILTSITITILGKKINQKGFFYLIKSFKQPLK